jgi:hypothetical protein
VEFTDVFEEVLEIVSYMTYFSPVISLNMWSLWPLMVDAVQDWAIDYFESEYYGWLLDDRWWPSWFLPPKCYLVT